jgi:hypothetical protein
MDSLDYPIINNNGIPVTLSLYAESVKSGSLEFREDAIENGELNISSWKAVFMNLI